MSVIGHMIGCRIFDKVKKDLQVEDPSYSSDEAHKLAHEHAKKLADKIVEDYFKEKK